ncbi:MAG TPA: hypothetical protein VE645_02115 [Pseudonocardiaceae bacterium]|jgi:hypothetical protein|nr:hypothetical protein [Pseudonocardiaceae bacterium]
MVLADVLAAPVDTEAEHRESRLGAGQGLGAGDCLGAGPPGTGGDSRFIDGATVRNCALGACDSQAHDSAVAEVGLMLAVAV